MRLLLQRVREGKVTIEGQNVASIGKGLVVLVGFGPEDTIDLRGGKLWNTLIEKMVGLRIFPDDEGKMNRGIEEAGGEIILVSQFTLYADSRKGRRPSFHLSRLRAWRNHCFSILWKMCDPGCRDESSRVCSLRTWTFPSQIGGR